MTSGDIGKQQSQDALIRDRVLKAFGPIARFLQRIHDLSSFRAATAIDLPHLNKDCCLI